MGTKKKTVKELNDIVEILEGKIVHLEEKVKQLERLEEKIKFLEDDVKRYKGYQDKETEILNGKKENRNCRKCDLTLETTKLLKDHMKTTHSKEIKCKDCGSIFDEQWNLEKHLHQEHGNEKTFSCEHCDERFYTNWRLKKHIKSHDEGNEKFCHYYNNFKECPYKELGCMFKHARSEQCRFQDDCKNKLCQFRHQRRNSIWRCKELNWEGKSCRFESRFEVRLNNHMKGEHEIGDSFACDYCDFQSSERTLLRKHIEEEHKRK